MAIVKMKKLHVIAMAEQREAILKGLQHLGCVEISEPDSFDDNDCAASQLRRETSEIAAVRTEIADVTTALSAIKEHSSAKDSLFSQRSPITEDEFLSDKTIESATAISRSVNANLQKLSQLRSEENRLNAQKAALLPWCSLNMPLEMSGTEHTIFKLGVCPAKTDTGSVRNALSEVAAELYEVSSDKQQRYYLLICHKSDAEQAMEILRPFNFSVTVFQGLKGSAADNVSLLERRLAENKAAYEAAVKAIEDGAEGKAELKLYLDRLNAEAAKCTAAEHLLTDGTVICFKGWVPAEKEVKVGAFLDKNNCAWETFEPTEEEIPDVPVKLKNNKFTQPLNAVTNMYVLPAYDGLDPNPLMAPFFIVFYGLMMADMGYGILMLLGSWIMLKKMHAKGGMKDFGGLLGLCGVSTFIFGALTGGFFGDFIPQLIKLFNPESTFALPYLFTPLTDTLMILVGSLVLGVIQIFTGMAISVVKKFKDGNWQDALWDEFTWWAVLIGAALALLADFKWLLYVGLVMLLYSGTRGKKGFGKITGIIGTVYNGVSGYFSDILSYARLMALMLAGAVIAQVFNTLGSVTGNVVSFIIISFIGNMLNLALNLLGCYVHDLRLQCLEFFNRFYKEGGKAFTPLEINTKYVDIVNNK